ncbi:MAG: hypothetical protein MHPSP_003026 [Paramarteilia canceri]
MKNTPISQLNGAQVTAPEMVKGNHTEHLKITDISLINDINMLNHDRKETDDCFGIESNLNNLESLKFSSRILLE